MYDASAAVYVSRMSHIEIDGPNFRIYLDERRNGSFEPAMEIVFPAEQMADAIMKAIMAMTAAGLAKIAIPFSELLMQ